MIVNVFRKEVPLENVCIQKAHLACHAEAFVVQGPLASDHKSRKSKQFTVSDQWLSVVLRSESACSSGPCVVQADIATHASVLSGGL
jgi:hypothetical protein